MVTRARNHPCRYAAHDLQQDATDAGVVGIGAGTVAGRIGTVADRHQGARAVPDRQRPAASPRTTVRRAEVRPRHRDARRPFAAGGDGDHQGARKQVQSSGRVKRLSTWGTRLAPASGHLPLMAEMAKKRDLRRSPVNEPQFVSFCMDLPRQLRRIARRPQRVAKFVFTTRSWESFTCARAVRTPAFVMKVRNQFVFGPGETVIDLGNSVGAGVWALGRLERRTNAPTRTRNAKRIIQARF